VSGWFEVQELSAFYGPTRVLFGVSFSLQQGSITTLLGANGAGKTTTMRALCAMVRTQGAVTLDGRRIDGLPTEDIVRKGVAHVPEGRGTFVNLTVEENLRLGAYTRRDKAEVQVGLERVYSHFPRLKERRGQQAGTLSGGEQQMLAVSRALMLRPQLLLLDEPSFGLSPMVVLEIFKIMHRINESERITILLVEQNASMALDLADSAYLLESGRVVLGGSSKEMQEHDTVRRVYLGY
jgi:branched-chain amino acid transport system ATP-binding protein